MEWILGIGWVAFVLIWFLRRSKNQTLDSKNDVKEIFNHFGSDLTVIQDVAVPVQGGMGHIDFAVVSSCEVFVISIIQANGKIRGDINSREWQTGKETIYNPVWRNHLLLNGLEHILKEVRLTSLIVFTNGTLADDFGENVVEFKNLKGFFKNREETGMIDTKSTIDALRKLKELG